VTEASAAPARTRRKAAALLSAALFLGATAVFVLSDHASLSDPLLYVLAPLALFGSLLAARYEGTVLIAADYGSSMLAVAFLGPAAVYLVNVFTELGTWAVRRYEPIKPLINLGAITPPAVAGALLFQELAGGLDDGSPAWLAWLTLVAVFILTLNFLLVGLLSALAFDVSIRSSLRIPRSLLPALGFNIVMVVLIAAIYADVGEAASLLGVVLVAGFGYMSHLVVRARDRTKEYANLSWGVLSGLIQTLDARDRRAARHCAAVARFSRDIAREAGLNERDQELAHTAGLLHDIGKFALSDRAMERDVILNEDDWRDIRRHPEIGATLLKDLGVYGPVAEIVRAHHERPDGRGYPSRLRGDQIPEIAKIVAVAEVYDTLTAPDTYRTPMSSFAALAELRRVSDRQLDGTYVEALAAVLAGEGTDYRHADAADFDRELDIQRRMNDAARR
jgi:putative nucleotidyltransferase with HDIG domain